jgi:hypothetical protein
MRDHLSHLRRVPAVDDRECDGRRFTEQHVYEQPSAAFRTRQTNGHRACMITPLGCLLVIQLVWTFAPFGKALNWATSSMNW